MTSEQIDYILENVGAGVYHDWDGKWYYDLLDNPGGPFDSQEAATEAFTAAAEQEPWPFEWELGAPQPEDLHQGLEHSPDGEGASNMGMGK